MSLARLIVMVVLGLGGTSLGQPSHVNAADPNWDYVTVGISNTDSDSFLVSDDGTYCRYPTNFPVKAESEVKLTAEPNGEPVVDTLNSLIEETYNEGEKGPGDGCAIWAFLDPVPMSTSYLFEISAEPSDDATNSSAYTGDMGVSLIFWTREFETSIGPDGGPACEPTSPTAMRPGGSFQSEPDGESLIDVGIVGQVSGDACRVMLILVLPPSGEITIAIGDAQLGGNQA